MFNREEICEIRLEDYTQPRYMSAIRPYYGTKDAINDLMDRLKSIDGANVRYEETINAVDFYELDENTVHVVAGQALPVLKPVNEMIRVSAQLGSRYWNYIACNGYVYPCYASKIDACQSLICTDSGYERCLKVTLYDLAISFPGVGWVSYRNNFKGFPGMVVSDGDKVSLALFASQEHYEPGEGDSAKADVLDFEKIDLSVAVADILGEG